VDLPIVPLALFPSAAATFLGRSTVVNNPNLGGFFHLVHVILPHLRLGLHLHPLLLLQIFLHLQLLLPEALPGLLLTSLLLPLLLVNSLGSSNMVLGLAEQILTLSSLHSSSSKVILLLVALDRKILEVLVADAQLVHGLQYFSQGALLIPQKLAGQLLKNQRNVVQDHRVMRRNSPSSQESHLGLFELASPEVGARKVLQHLDIGVLVELLQAVLVHLNC